MVMESIESKGKTLIGGKYKEVMKETICFKPKHHFLKVSKNIQKYFLVVE